jgi:hypothetical protein
MKFQILYSGRVNRLMTKKANINQAFNLPPEYTMGGIYLSEITNTVRIFLYDAPHYRKGKWVRCPQPHHYRKGKWVIL